MTIKELRDIADHISRGESLVINHFVPPVVGRPHVRINGEQISQVSAADLLPKCRTTHELAVLLLSRPKVNLNKGGFTDELFGSGMQLVLADSGD